METTLSKPFYPTPTGAPIPQVTPMSAIKNLASKKITIPDIDAIINKLTTSLKPSAPAPETIIKKMAPNIQPKAEPVAPMEFKVGEIVLFKRYAGDDFFMDENFNIYPSHEEQREDILPVKVLRLDSILHSLP